MTSAANTAPVRARAVSLFSGILGLDLAVEAAIPCETVAYAERDSFCQAVIRARRPQAVIYDDVRDLCRPNLAFPGLDLLHGGFPCQDVSQAGRRRNMHGARSGGGWRAMLEAIEATRPRVVFVENVAGLRNAGLGLVLGELAGLGFDAEWSTIRAADVGAPHLRRRIFIVAARGPVPHAVGDPIRELRERDREQHPFAWQAVIARDRVSVADADEDRRARPGTSHDDDRDHALRVDDPGRDPWPPGPDDQLAWARWRRAGGPEPGIRRGAPGLSTRLDRRRRSDRLRALGNAVCWPQALEAFVELVGRFLDDPPERRSPARPVLNPLDSATCAASAWSARIP